MPTGYTAAIKDGISFQQFTYDCARAFGALIMMRDEPSDAPIPDKFEPSNYHSKELLIAKEEKDRIESLSKDEREIESKKYNDEKMESWEKRKAEKEELGVKYKNMLAKAIQWQAPTPDHEGLKEFMIKQIKESIDWDCSMKHDLKPEILNAFAWYKMKIKKLDWKIKYHIENNESEIKRSEDRTKWVTDLKQSFK